MHENENFAPGMHDFFAPEIFMWSWPVHNFMHGFFTHEHLLGRTFIFMHENFISCMEISFSCMKMKICCMKYSIHTFSMHDIFSYGSYTGTPELAWYQLRKYRIKAYLPNILRTLMTYSNYRPLVNTNPLVISVEVPSRSFPWKSLQCSHLIPAPVDRTSASAWLYRHPWITCQKSQAHQCPW